MIGPGRVLIVSMIATALAAVGLLCAIPVWP